MAPKKNPFADFTPLSRNDNIYLYRAPDSAGRATRSKSAGPIPDLVVLSTWMAAAPKHILKYTASYQKTYPQATILLITNDIADIFLRPNSFAQNRVAPAAEYIHKYNKEHPDARILLHGFSNGGALQSIQLAREYRKKYGGVLPITAMALDSLPGHAQGFKEGMEATLLALPAVMRPIAAPLVFVAIFFYWMKSHVFGVKNAIDDIRDGLLDKSLWPTSVPRVYVYGKGDEIVRYRDVEEHAAQAKEGGWTTKLTEIQGSAHVTHMMKDPERYWQAVTGILSSAKKPD